MLDFTTLQIVWFFLAGLVLCIFACTAGFDYGATLIMPFLKDEDERRITLNVSGQTWDGNQTWLVFAGGALFVIWPVVYGAVFSGLYAVMLFILWSLFMRPPGYDYRGKIHSHVWRRFWDWGLFISSFFPVVMFGMAFGNLMQGLPISFDTFTMRDYMGGNFFDLFSHFTIICGVISLLMFLSHGASLLHRRTEGELKTKYANLHRLFTIMLIFMMTVAALMATYSVKGYTLVSSPLNPTENPLANVVTQSVGAWTASYAVYPWKIAGPVLAYLGLLFALFSSNVGRGGLSFWANCVGISGLVLTAGFNMFPFVLPSSTHLAQSLTVFNASSAHYTLNSMFWLVLVMMVIVLIYKIFAYMSIWSKTKTIDTQYIKENDHSMY